EDFRITVDGKPVPIDYFTRVAEGTIHAPDLATASPDLVLAEYRKGPDAYIPRQYLLYVDVGNLSPNNRKRGLDALRDLVTRMGPSDLARVVLFDRRGKEQTQWTSSKEQLFGALDRIEKSGVGMSRLMAETQAIHQIDTMPARARASVARTYADQERMEVETLLKDMSAELTTLTGLPGRRAFVLVTGGFDTNPGYAMFEYALGRFGVGLQGLESRSAAPMIDSLIRQANASDVTFYTVDARGLNAEGGSAADDGPLVSRPGVSFTARQESQAALLSLAGETGGLALLNTNGLNRGLERVYQDTSTYYSVGVTLANLPPSGTRKVSVNVTRPGLTVRSRRSYSVKSAGDRAGDVTVAALRSNVRYQGIPVTLATAAPTRAKKYYTVPVVITVPARSLTFLPAGKDMKAATDLYFAVMDDSGNMSNINREEASFSLPADAPADAPVKYTATLSVRKGNARIVVNVRDRETGKMGTAKADLHVE
ncbi:MAG TPA: VWA domain-containing protein, partial [Thermoanaerobaculia bacterium]